MNRDRSSPSPELPLISPLGDSALLVRFGTELDNAANRAAIAFAKIIRAADLGGVEVVPNLVSVMVRYDRRQTSYANLAGELRMLRGRMGKETTGEGREFLVEVVFGGETGPDLAKVAAGLGLSPEQFIEQHNAKPLRVLATGFAPGFVYCGFHPDVLRVSRRPAVRARVAPGTVLFAAGQTAITATAIPTGWHVIGRTAFRNFDPSSEPPTRLSPGDLICFQITQA